MIKAYNGRVKEESRLSGMQDNDIFSYR